MATQSAGMAPTKHQTISIVVRNFRVLHRYCIVNVLETFDSDGVIERHVGRVRSDRTPHFNGAGVVAS